MLYLICFLTIIILVYIFRNSLFSFVRETTISFSRTLIEENRYILFLQGLYSTFMVSIVSIIVGTLIGMVICYLRKKNILILNSALKIYVNIMQGIPITVLILIFYYIIFGEININPMIVAIITFSLYFSAYTSELFRAALNSINDLQVKSAYALGFNKLQTLKYIVLPQALTYIIPVFKNEVVSLIKLTSIIGYISIMDVTKASDIIRNRTYEAFFPLIVAALLYFLICYLISKLLDFLYKKINRRGNGGCYVKDC